MRRNLLQCMSLEVARSVDIEMSAIAPLLGVNRT
jgi:hypothetical protein